jgi:hypothetical protein
VFLSTGRKPWQDPSSMDRRTFLQRPGMATLAPLCVRDLWGAVRNPTRDAGVADLPNTARIASKIRRRRPSDANWPSQAAWKRLSDEVDGNLIPVEFPIEACVKDTGSAGCQNLISSIHNPYYIGDQPGMTETLGWVDAWVSKPSVYAVAARSAGSSTADKPAPPIGTKPSSLLLRCNSPACPDRVKATMLCPTVPTYVPSARCSTGCTGVLPPLKPKFAVAVVALPFLSTLVIHKSHAL